MRSWTQLAQTGRINQTAQPDSNDAHKHTQLCTQTQTVRTFSANLPCSGEGGHEYV